MTSREPLRPGLDGLKQTVDKVRLAIVRGGKDPAVRIEAERMARYAGAHDYASEIEAIFEGVLDVDAPPYRKDPVDMELLKGPSAAATSLGIDCDEFVIRAGALLQALGHPVELDVMGRARPVTPAKAKFTHIRLRVFDTQRRKWIPFDPVLRDPRRRPHAKVGDEAPAGVIARFRVSLYRSPQMLGNFFDDLANFGKQLDITNPKNSVLRNVVSAIPVVGTGIVGAADSLAAVNKATGGGLTNIANQALGVKPAPSPRPVAVVSARPTPLPSAPMPPQVSVSMPRPRRRLGTGAKLAIGAAVVGGAAYLLTHDKKKKAA